MRSKHRPGRHTTPPVTRKTLGGCAIEVHNEPLILNLTTKVPTKWVAVDLETGDVWSGQRDGKWKRADSRVRREVTAVVSKPA